MSTEAEQLEQPEQLERLHQWLQQNGFTCIDTMGWGCLCSASGNRNTKYAKYAIALRSQNKRVVKEHSIGWSFSTGPIFT